MESFRQSLGAVYFALAQAAGGEQVLREANLILTDAVDHGAITDPFACLAIGAIVSASEAELER